MPFPSTAEKILLLLLIAASLTGFFRRFSKVAAIIQAAKSDPAFSLGSLIPRLKIFLWEVLCQGKVIQQRPVAGLAHAFVFWGFLAFGLVTVNHFALGFGFPLLSRLKHQLPLMAADQRETVVYHDPCYLGRYRGVYDEPREVLTRAVDLLEAPRNREKSFCCGAGGGQMFLGEEKGTRVNTTRAKELVATGATTVAAGCPFCASMFKDALKTVSDTPPQLLDIAQIVARGLPEQNQSVSGGSV